MNAGVAAVDTRIIIVAWCIGPVSVAATFLFLGYFFIIFCMFQLRLTFS